MKSCTNLFNIVQELYVAENLILHNPNLAHDLDTPKYRIQLKN